MKYSTVFFGALATASMVSAAGYGYPAPAPAPASSAAPSKYVAPAPAPAPSDDCEDMSYPVSVPPKPSSSHKVAPAPASSTPCDEDKYPKPSSSKKVGPVSVKPVSSYKKVYPYPVITETIIIVVPEFTIECHGPTILIEESETVVITETIETIVTFSKGPYHRTQTMLECGPTTTTYFKEAPCPTGWPYETGYSYTPLPCSYVPVEVYPVVSAVAVPAPAPYYAAPSAAPYSPPPAVAAVAAAPVGSSYPVAVSAQNASSPYTAPVATFSSGASHSQAGVVALIAGVVAAMMVL